MPLGTIASGDLRRIDDCFINIPGAKKIFFFSLPDITDSKSAAYNDEPIIGRAFPMKTYSHSENRVISMQIHLYVSVPADIPLNIANLRAIESATYPRDQASGANASFIPPPVCEIKCGRLLGDTPLCVILKSYSVKFPIDVTWDAETFIPFKFDIDTNWEVVYRTSELPGQTRIASEGR